MNVLAYREFLEKNLVKLNSIISKNMAPILIRDFTNEELLLFVQEDLTIRRKAAVETYFTDKGKTTLEKAGKLLGITGNRVRQLLHGSFQTFIKEGGRFRIH